MAIILTISSGVLLLIGSFLCISGGMGLLRFPDFYTRIHAVSITDTLGAGMILLGLMLHSTDFIVISKLVIVLLLTWLVGPTTSHVLAKSAWHNGLLPKVQDHSVDKTNSKETSSSNP